MGDVSHSVILSTVHEIVVPFVVISPTDFSKPNKLLRQVCRHTEQLAEVGSSYFTTSLDGVNTGFSSQLLSVTQTLNLTTFIFNGRYNFKTIAIPHTMTIGAAGALIFVKFYVFSFINLWPISLIVEIVCCQVN